MLLYIFPITPLIAGYLVVPSPPYHARITSRLSIHIDRPNVMPSPTHPRRDITLCGPAATPYTPTLSFSRLQSLRTEIGAAGAPSLGVDLHLARQPADNTQPIHRNEYEACAIGRDRC
jgi:hypothetical protein